MSVGGATVALVEVAIWTTLAVLAGFSFSALFYLGHRIDQLGTDIRVEIRYLASRIDGTNARIDGLSARFDGHLEQHARLK